MKLYKHNSEGTGIVEINGTPFPGTDSDGQVCYHSTHFHTEDEAWKSLLQDAMAGIRLAGLHVKNARGDLLFAEKQSAEACERYQSVLCNLPTHIKRMMRTEP